MPSRLRGLAAAVFALAALPAAAADPCRAITHAGEGYTVCTVAAGADLRLFHTAPDGRVFGSFERIEAALAATGAQLAFAMNAGMYHADRSPVGLYIEDGVERSPAVTAASRDNFGMLPNGVFCIAPDRVAVIETRAFLAAPPPCRHATQSGPMLLIDGTVHPRFIPGSTSRHIRNGVGVSADGQTAHFAISDRRVNFHDFAVMFRDALGLRDALYLDGSISRLYAPGIGRRDGGLPLGPIVGLVTPRG